VAGKDLDHTTDSVGAVKARARTAHDFDVVDLLHRKLLERRQPGGDRTDPHAVDQHQRMSGVGAAQKQRRLLADAAGLRKRHARQAVEQIDHRYRLQPFDIGAADHGVRVAVTITGSSELVLVASAPVAP
jgi:hypothetical protein